MSGWMQTTLRRRGLFRRLLCIFVWVFNLALPVEFNIFIFILDVPQHVDIGYLWPVLYVTGGACLSFLVTTVAITVTRWWNNREVRDDQSRWFNLHDWYIFRWHKLDKRLWMKISKWRTIRHYIVLMWLALACIILHNDTFFLIVDELLYNCDKNKWF